MDHILRPVRRAAPLALLPALLTLSCSSREKTEALHLLQQTRPKLSELAQSSQDLQVELSTTGKAMGTGLRARMEANRKLYEKANPMCKDAQKKAQQLRADLEKDGFEYRTKLPRQARQELMTSLDRFASPTYGYVGGKDCMSPGTFGLGPCMIQCLEGFRELGIAWGLVRSAAIVTGNSVDELPFPAPKSPASDRKPASDAR